MLLPRPHHLTCKVFANYDPDGDAIYVVNGQKPILPFLNVYPVAQWEEHSCSLTIFMFKMQLKVL
jgi:hypothetical protein